MRPAATNVARSVVSVLRTRVHCQTGEPVVNVDRRIRWHYTTTILRLRIGARLTSYQNCKFHNFAPTISRHADGISRYSVPPSAGPLLPLGRTDCEPDFLWGDQTGIGPRNQATQPCIPPGSLNGVPALAGVNAYCREQSNFELPSVILARHTGLFLDKLRHCDNCLMKNATRT